jgi:hypothetical protein
MFDLNSGELFVALFILITVVSAPLWPKAGEWIAVQLWQRSRPTKPGSRA